MAYNLLAITQNGLNNLDKSLEYHFKAKESIVAIESEATRELYGYINSNNLGSSYLRAENYSNAIEILNELLVNPDKLKSKRISTYRKALANRAMAKLNLNNYTQEMVEADLALALEAAKASNSTYDLSRIHHGFAKPISSLTIGIKRRRVP